jgi:molybdopterin/thiamine biosynthesis adenylyltransferase
VKEVKRIKVVGLGGIGSHLVEPLAKYLEHTDAIVEITLIDGDVYENKNRSRQRVPKLGNKASVTVENLRPQFAKVTLTAVPEYVTEDNALQTIREKDVVFLCVDNHATRKVVSDRCKELDDVVLISGGNDLTDGNVIYYRRTDGEDVTRAPTELFQEIAAPEDFVPGTAGSQGCERQMESSPQLLCTNLAAASHMLNLYYGHEQGTVEGVEQVYFDIRTHRSRPSPERFE